jgi:hypothetical protein
MGVFRLVQDKIGFDLALGVMAQIIEQAFNESRLVNAPQELLGHDLVSVKVLAVRYTKVRVARTCSTSEVVRRNHMLNALHGIARIKQGMALGRHISSTIDPCTS